MSEEIKKEEEQRDQGPQPIEFKAILYPDGNMAINCPLMENPISMLGLIDMIHDGVKIALKEKTEKRIIPPTKNPGFFNGLRRMK